MAVGDETLRDFSPTRIRDPLIGSTVDDYLVQAIIGTGAMGIVYRGVHQVIGKAVAIKVLKPDYATDPEMEDRLMREARTVNAIRHPAIVDIFGIGKLKNGQRYIVMDLLVGEPLDSYIKREAPVPPKVAFPILDELLGALGAAHGVGVIHRDLKPGNVFIESHPDVRSRIKVIDFGLARQADRAGGSVRPTNPGTLLGTPAFMAPEQVLGTKVTPATDLYAVGGIAYQLLTGHLPHEAPSAIEVISQKMKFDPIRPAQWNPKLEPELDTWVMSLLAREVDDRPSNAEEVRSQLRRAVDARTQDSPAVQRRSSGGPQPVHKPKSGANPAHRPAASGGVVPKREWNAAKTLLVDGVPPIQDPVESTTDRQFSPFAQTAIYGQPAVTPPMSPPPAITPHATPPPPASPPPPSPADAGTQPDAMIPPLGNSTVLLPAPDQLLTPVATGPVPAAPAEDPNTSPELDQVRPSLWPYFVTGAIALALIGVLVWALRGWLR